VRRLGDVFLVVTRKIGTGEVDKCLSTWVDTVSEGSK
jgi:hypothetical protein